tara:strand:- start:948 stop:1718 length:771 start_codon:yes stop_codon:yes gene_type:complete
MSQKLSGKIALVTAAGGAGMGQAIARRFIQEGAKVVVTDSHERRVKEVASELSSEIDDEVLGLKLDVRSQDDVNSCVEQTLATHGTIDILYNNAGINKISPVWELSDEDWTLILDVCLTGTFRLTRAVLPSMIKQKSGAIINVSSIAGWRSDPTSGGQSAYAAAKAGVMGLTRSTAAEVGEHGIRANAIAPGLIYNQFLERIYDKSWFEMQEQQNLVGRIGQSDDVASLAVFLASDDSSFITGEVMCISGGRYMHA